jgi:integrase
MISPSHPIAEQLELFAEGPFTLRVTIEDAVRIFWDNYWSHLPFGSKSHAHRERILQFFKGSYLDSISKADVERFRRRMKENGYTDSTINKSHMMLARIFTKFQEYKEGRFVNGVDFSKIVLPEKSPAAQVPRVNEKKRGRKEAPKPEEMRRLISYADEDLKDILNGLYWTLLRPSDFFRITDRNVNLSRMMLEGTQHKTITTRNPTGNPYRIPITIDLAIVLKRRMETTKPGTALFRRKNIPKRFNRARGLADLNWVQLGRDIRRAGAIQLLDKGIDPYTVAELLGHSSLDMLPRYTPRTDKHLKEAAEKLVEA